MTAPDLPPPAGAATPPAPGHRPATCPRCGGAFACGVDADRTTPCFCAGIALDASRLAQLRARYPDCLCSTCLQALANDVREEA